MTVAVWEVEPEVLGELEVKEGVQIREGHQFSFVPDFYHTERKLRRRWSGWGIRERPDMSATT